MSGGGTVAVWMSVVHQTASLWISLVIQTVVWIFFTQSKVNKASCICIALYCWKGGESFFIGVIFHYEAFLFWSCHYFVKAVSVCYCEMNSCFDWLYSQQQWQIQARLQRAIILILQALSNKNRKNSLWFNYTFIMSAWRMFPNQPRAGVTIRSAPQHTDGSSPISLHLHAEADPDYYLWLWEITMWAEVTFVKKLTCGFSSLCSTAICGYQWGCGSLSHIVIDQLPTLIKIWSV